MAHARASAGAGRRPVGRTRRSRAGELAITVLMGLARHSPPREPRASDGPRTAPPGKFGYHGGMSAARVRIGDCNKPIIVRCASRKTTLSHGCHDETDCGYLPA